MTLRDRLFTASFCAVLVLVPSMRAQSSAVDLLLHMRQASNLDADDKVPYHIKISYDLYDLKGRKKSTGTIERWSWPGAGHSRLIVAGATYHSPIPEGVQVKANREYYLVSLLTRAMTNPAPSVPQKASSLVALDRTVQGADYDCVAPRRAPAGGAQLRYAPEDEQFADDQDAAATRQWCAPAGSDVLRVAFDDYDFVALHNKIANFNGVSYAQEVTLLYYGKVAIVGHVDTLETYKPTAAELAPVTPAAKPSLPPGVPVGVVTGKPIKKVSPSYPQSAKSNHIGGTVLLMAIITKEGKISSLDVIASPDKSLSDAAMDAVKHWTYQPYLLNGQPTEVDTRITVNFNLNLAN